MTRIDEDDYPLEWRTLVSTEDLTALRVFNRLSKGAAKDNAPLRAHLKQLRKLEQKMAGTLIIGTAPDVVDEMTELEEAEKAASKERTKR